jgi:hypothetical protein
MTIRKLIAALPLGPALAVATLAATAVAYLATGGGLFSPGALNAQNRSGEALQGVHSHAELSKDCAACHAANSGAVLASGCKHCHTGIQAQITGGLPMHGKLTNPEDCSACHSEHKGATASITDMANFNHAATRFPLTGQHKQLDCAQCHKDEQYKGTPRSCVECHADPEIHRGKFGLDCASCHTTATWKGATFDHTTTRFSLTGQHKQLNCAQCHKDEQYKGTPRSCVECHADPEVHRGKFGLDCASCHTTATWKGATFEHEFPLTHGGHKRNPISCATCHTTPGNYKSYTCYECHEHDKAKMERKHREIRTSNLADCASCHPTGREDERKRERKRESSSLNDSRATVADLVSFIQAPATSPGARPALDGPSVFDSRCTRDGF